MAILDIWPFTRRQNDPVTAQMLSEVDKKAHERAKRFARAWNAYCGKLPKPLVVAYGEMDDNVILSYARITVDKGVAALFGECTEFEEDAAEPTQKARPGQPIEGEAIPTDPQEDTPVDLALDDLWDQNKKQTFLHNVGVNGGVFGHVFVEIQIDPSLDYPRFLNLDPQQIDVITSSEDYERVEQFIQTWHGVQYDETLRRVVGVAYRKRTIRNLLRWEIVREESRDGKPFVQVGAQVWPYEWCPIHHCQNLPVPNEFWGMSDIEDDVLSVHSGISFAASNINKILRLWAHPFLYGKGFDPTEIERDPASMMVLPPNSPDAEIKALEMQGDLSSSLEFLDKLKQAYDEQTRIPGIARGNIENLGDVSGVALKILYSPLTEKTNAKHGTYGDMLEELCRHALEVMGMAADVEVCVKWPNPIPSDEAGQADTALKKLQIGFSKQTLIAELGGDAQTEAANRQAEDQAALDMQTEADMQTMSQRFNRGQI